MVLCNVIIPRHQAVPLRSSQLLGTVMPPSKVPGSPRSAPIGKLACPSLMSPAPRDIIVPFQCPLILGTLLSPSKLPSSSGQAPIGIHLSLPTRPGPGDINPSGVPWFWGQHCPPLVSPAPWNQGLQASACPPVMSPALRLPSSLSSAPWSRGHHNSHLMTPAPQDLHPWASLCPTQTHRIPGDIVSPFVSLGPGDTTFPI